MIVAYLSDNYIILITLLIKKNIAPWFLSSLLKFTWRLCFSFYLMHCSNNRVNYSVISKSVQLDPVVFLCDFSQIIYWCCYPVKSCHSEFLITSSFTKKYCHDWVIFMPLDWIPELPQIWLEVITFLAPELPYIHVAHLIPWAHKSVQW